MYKRQIAYQRLIVLSGALAAGAFAAAFTGAMNLDVKWLQASGSMAVFALVWIFDPVATKQPADPIESPASIEQPKKQIKPTEQGVLRLLGINSAFAQGQNENSLMPEAISIDQHPIQHLRVYYPRGVSDLNRVAYRISRGMSSIARETDVYSLGSFFAAPLNYLRYESGRYQLAMAYRPGLDQGIINDLVAKLRSLDMNIDAENIEPRRTSADISVYVRLL